MNLSKLTVSKTTQLSLLGMVFILVGTTTADPLLKKWLFFIGSPFFLISAIMMRHRFLMSTEWVINTGTTLAMLPLPWVVKSYTPIVLGVVLGVYHIYRKDITSPLNLLGLVMVILLAVGFAIENPYIYLMGGIVATLYTGIETILRVPGVWIWFILNSIFTLSVLYGILNVA